MRILVIVTLMVGGLFSCSTQSGKQTRLVQNTQFEPFSSYTKPAFDEPFFNEDHFDYVADTQHDSIKFVYTSETTIQEYSSSYFLRNCNIALRADSLLLRFNDSPFSGSLFQLDITKVHDQYISRYYQTFSFSDNTDTAFQQPIFKIVDQHIILDKTSYEKGDSLKGKFVIKVAAHRTEDTDYTHMINIYGLVKNIVQ